MKPSAEQRDDRPPIQAASRSARRFVANLLPLLPSPHVVRRLVVSGVHFENPAKFRVSREIQPGLQMARFKSCHPRLNLLRQRRASWPAPKNSKPACRLLQVQILPPRPLKHPGFVIAAHDEKGRTCLAPVRDSCRRGVHRGCSEKWKSDSRALQAAVVGYRSTSSACRQGTEVTRRPCSPARRAHPIGR